MMLRPAGSVTRRLFASQPLMRLGTKILLLTLLITIGSSAVVSWMVTRNVTTFETNRANDEISRAIVHYVNQLDERHREVSRVVRAMLEAPEQRSLLGAANDSSDRASREQLRQEVLGRDVQAELQSHDGGPAFHVLLDGAGETLVVAETDPKAAVPFDKVRWPVDAVLNSHGKPVVHYVASPGGLFLAMGVPLRTQLNEPPNDAYFVGFRVDDAWAREQLLTDRLATPSGGAPLTAWFLVDDAVVARASADPADGRVSAFRPDAPLRPVAGKGGAASDRVEFDVAGEHYLGRVFPLDPTDAKAGRLILGSSLDQALRPLHRLQREILLTTLIACAIAILACRAIALMISRPVGELVRGTQRIAAGQFDDPVQIHRRDELGALAESFNQMSQGLRERDHLRDERLKMERDLAVARKIQMDVLPKTLPQCPGYDLAACSLPAEATGGDIYDLVALALEPPRPEDPPSLVLLLADATGHGIGPALSVTQVRSMLRIGVRLRAGLDDVFAQINRQLCQDLGSERFVTAFLGLLDPSAHSIDYHSAGQGPLLHFHAHDHRFEWLDTSMLPLGIMEDPEGDGRQSMHLAPGDMIVLLTDGFYEYQREDNEQFGKERVADVILQHHHRTSRELLEALLAAMRAFAGGAPQMDDMTALIIKRLP